MTGLYKLAALGEGVCPHCFGDLPDQRRRLAGGDLARSARAAGPGGSHLDLVAAAETIVAAYDRYLRDTAIQDALGIDPDQVR
ncbi:hypothetical protein [Streptosporangium sp. LJ11]|uniref:hypothetical protein n=1 Tax=Streptosporangium sp. LJ11 TaxID=3436927 RepID=UPI003F79BA9D